ncbi:IS481 family transposase [Changpingibacter yushuensis]|uniref:IS481 family transposase n=1 Tax=Changpingibacter yushuensis TaxID=2758440 RepID=UPI0015F6EA5B|nr:IS481 family transposase [Changpingibacter yushuensis]
MNTSNQNRVIILSIAEGGLSVAEAATRFNVSQRWIYTLLARYKAGGIDAVDPRSRRPHTNPNATDPTTVEAILTLREDLTTAGLDAGAESIWDRLDTETRPSPATIWRILTRHDKITPQPHKRPRSSWHRFEAAAPNETWQSDFTHWTLEDGTDTEIISWLDDHSRLLLHATAYARITGSIVTDTFTTTMDIYGPPASTLTDNGMVYTTRFARGNDGQPRQPNGFEQLLADMGITQKNGAANHPTTQGKIERYHQTLKHWLSAQPRARNLDELNTQLAQFTDIYNTQRPHRALGRRTPAQVYTATIKAEPTKEIGHTFWRVRYDRVDKDGKITLRYAGKLRHLGIGRAHIGSRLLLLIHGPNTMAIDRNTGEIIAEHAIDSTKNYQPKK